MKSLVRDLPFVKIANELRHINGQVLIGMPQESCMQASLSNISHIKDNRVCIYSKLQIQQSITERMLSSEILLVRKLV